MRLICVHGAVPPSTRRLLVAVQQHPERRQRVQRLLDLLGRLLQRGNVENHLAGVVGTDWRRLRTLARWLRDEAHALGVRETVALCDRLCGMADAVLGE